VVRMEKEEKIWLGIIALVAIIFNAVTLSPLVPWVHWDLFNPPQPKQIIRVHMRDHKFFLVEEGEMKPLKAGTISIKAGVPVKFVVTSEDLTYGFGVFDPEGRMVFQMQVIPKYENSMVWIFDEPGYYTVRSTEYSGPQHPYMFVEGAIQVLGGS